MDPQPAPAASVDPALLSAPFPAAAPQQDIASQVLGTQPPPVNVQNLTAQLQDVYQRKVTAEKQAGDLNLAQLQHDRNQAATMLHAEGIGPDTNLKWDARAKSAEYSTNPMEAFGSFASVFAILASSFTRAPMANALNGAAAAMNAIKANDDKGYQRGYEAYKSNAELAMKRQQMQHEQYQDALELMKVDATIGQARMTATAARFGDEIVLRELQNGFNPAIEKLIEDRSNNALRMAEVLPRMEELNLKVQAVQRVQEARKGGDPGELAAAMQNLRDVQSGFSAAGARTLSPDQQVMQRMIDENPEITGEDLAKKFAEYKQAEKPEKSLSPDQAFTKKYFTEHPDATPEQFGKDYGSYRKEQKEPKTLTPDQQILQRIITENPDISADDLAKKYDAYKAGQHPGASGGATNLTIDRQNAAAAAKHKEELEKAGVPAVEAQKSADDLYRELKMRTEVPSGNRLDDIASRITLIRQSESKIDEAIDSLQRHVGEAGLAGKVTRLGERVSNIFGSNQTDRAQFMRTIEYLRLEAPRLLTDSHGRPLSAEASKIGDVVAGVSPGDTTANALRGLEEYKQFLIELRAENEQRYNKGRIGEGGGETTPAATPAVKPPAKNDWWSQY